MNIRKLRRDDVVLVDCAELVPEGLGLSHLVGHEDRKPRTGFIWGALPGEQCLVRVIKSQGNHFHGVVLRRDQTEDEFEHPFWALNSPSAKRVDAGCDNFVACGGCKLQHLEYEDTLDYKAAWLKSHLQHNQVEHPEVSIIASPQTQHYRNHVQVHINKHKERGFYAPGSYRTIAFPEHGCRLFDQPLFDRDFPEEYVLERCVRGRFDGLSGEVGHWSLYSKQDKEEGFTYSIAYPPGSTTRVTIPNTAFFQVNNYVVPTWLALIAEQVPGDRVLELFSGFGFISRMLSMVRPIESMGVDILKPTELGRVTLENDQFDVQPLLAENYIQADLTILDRIGQADQERLRAHEPECFVVNPPRSGFLPDQIRFLFDEVFPEARPPFIYSSCNAATFARDAQVLVEKGYALKSLHLLDFFPWTSHYEVLGVFR